MVADPKNPQAFIYAPPSSTSILGIITQAVPRYATCEIATTGTADNLTNMQLDWYEHINIV